MTLPIALEVKYLYFSVTCFLGIEERLGFFPLKKYVCYIYSKRILFLFGRYASDIFGLNFICRVIYVLCFII